LVSPSTSVVKSWNRSRACSTWLLNERPHFVPATVSRPRPWAPWKSANAPKRRLMLSVASLPALVNLAPIMVAFAPAVSAASPTSRVSVAVFFRPRETSAWPLSPSRMKRSSVGIRLTSDQGPCDGQDSAGVGAERERDDLAGDDAADAGGVGEFLHALLVGLLDQARSTSFSTRSPGARTRIGSMPTRSARLASWKPG
jgi:hypothetical protein